MTPSELVLRATWGGRVDSRVRQAAMVWDCWQRLAALGGFFARGWYSAQTKPNQIIPVSSLAILEADITRTCYAGHGGFYAFIQSAGELRYDEMPPHMSITVSVAGCEGGNRMAANRVVVDMQVGEKARLKDPLPFDWLLGIGPQLVKDFVDVWQPDAVSLDSFDLVKLNPHKGSAHPVVGYFTWLGPLVAEPATLPDTPVREAYAGGTLFGIEPATPDPVGDATAIAVPLYESGVLNPIPFIQGQPNSPKTIPSINPDPGHHVPGRIMAKVKSVLGSIGRRLAR